jgi:hypothetical protein
VLGRTQLRMPVLRQAPDVIRKAQMASRMKNWLFLVFSIWTSNIYSQDTLLVNQIKFDQIRSISYSLPARTQKPIYEDAAFNYFLKEKRKVLDFLIQTITDTALTTIERKSTNGFYKKGDLAIILISNIESIPYTAITGVQWCICCETGYIPVDFFSYLDRNRSNFQSKYKNYSLGQGRKKSLKQNRKDHKT